jgi:hypothetical protein
MADTIHGSHDYDCMLRVLPHGANCCKFSRSILPLFLRTPRVQFGDHVLGHIRCGSQSTAAGM